MYKNITHLMSDQLSCVYFDYMSFGCSSKPFPVPVYHDYCMLYKSVHPGSTSSVPIWVVSREKVPDFLSRCHARPPFFWYVTDFSKKKKKKKKKFKKKFF